MKITILTGKTNEILRKKSEVIKINELKKYTQIGEEMVRYLKKHKDDGVGLAAPQIGINKRLIAVSLLKDYEDENFKTVFFLNPEILEYSVDTEIDVEGCLSIPGETGEVERSYTIKLGYIDEKGVKKNMIFFGLSARILQHEIDHLDGVLFTDRVSKTPHQ